MKYVKGEEHITFFEGIRRPLGNVRAAINYRDLLGLLHYSFNFNSLQIVSFQFLADVSVTTRVPGLLLYYLFPEPFQEKIKVAYCKIERSPTYIFFFTLCYRYEWDEWPYKRHPGELSHSFFHVRTQREDGCQWTKKQALIRHYMCQHL